MQGPAVFMDISLEDQVSSREHNLNIGYVYTYMYHVFYNIPVVYDRSNTLQFTS